MFHSSIRSQCKCQEMILKISTQLFLKVQLNLVALFLSTFSHQLDQHSTYYKALTEAQSELISERHKSHRMTFDLIYS